MLDDDDDARLMEAAGRGDRAAFARLFDRHQGSVVRFCTRFVSSQARAEELAQDIFIKLFRSAKGYVRTARFKTFMFRIATNHCLNEVRRGKNVEQLEDSNVSDDDRPTAIDREASGDSPDLHLEGKELERAVERAMAQMSDRERAAFSMCRFEGMPYRDIATTLTASEAAVKSLIHRATVQVMKHIEAMQSGLVAQGSHV